MMNQIKAAGLLIAVIILLPFFVLGATVHYGHAHGLILTVMVLLGAAIPNQWMRLFIFYVAAYLAYIVFGLFIGFITANASITSVLIDGSIWIILGTVWFLIIYRSEVESDIIINTLCIIALIQASLGVLQSLGFDPVFDIFRAIVVVRTELPATAAVGTLGNNNFLAAYVAIALPLFFRRRWFYAIPVLISCLVVCKTTTAFIAAIVGTCFYFLPYFMSLDRVRIAAMCGAVISAIAAYVIYHPITQNDRPDLWLDGIQKVTKSWQTLLIGYGPTAEWQEGNKLHSEYVMTLYNFGVIGFGLLISYIVSVFKSVQQVNRCLIAAFIVICVDAVGNHLMHTIPTAIMAITIMALIERERKEATI